MAVLFKPQRLSAPLQPTQTAQLLQGFLNIQQRVSVQDGVLTPEDLGRYNQLLFFAPDPNARVADYLTQNFTQIAPLDGNPESISVDDLVIRRPGLPGNKTPIDPDPFDSMDSSEPHPHIDPLRDTLKKNMFGLDGNPFKHLPDESSFSI